jgi:hypothetical protein
LLQALAPIHVEPAMALALFGVEMSLSEKAWRIIGIIIILLFMACLGLINHLFEMRI